MAQVNEQIRINATFYFDDDTGDSTPGVVVEPTAVLFEVLNADDDVIYSDDAVQEGNLFYHSYTPTVEGAHTFRFTASFADANDLVVEQTVTIGPETATPEYLDSDYTIIFASNLDPLYLDPDELKVFFPNLSEYELAEAIYIASLKAKAMLKLSDTDVPPDFAIDYVHAAAACSLSRIEDGGFDGSFLSSGFTLGDLVITNTSSNKTNDANTGNVGSWCELAFLLEREMKYKSTTLKSFVKGGVYANPIIERRMPGRFGQRGVIKDTGRIDD